MCDWLQWGAHPKMSEFIALSDLEPSRYAMSFIEETNLRAYKVEIAFMALDAENLGELVNDHFHTDFGDNKFPYYKGNKNVRINKKKYQKTNDLSSGDSSNDDDDSSSDEDDIDPTLLSPEDLERLDKFIPHSVLAYLSVL